MFLYRCVDIHLVLVIIHTYTHTHISADNNHMSKLFQDTLDFGVLQCRWMELTVMGMDGQARAMDWVHCRTTSGLCISRAPARTTCCDYMLKEQLCLLVPWRHNNLLCTSVCCARKSRTIWTKELYGAVETTDAVIHKHSKQGIYMLAFCYVYANNKSSSKPQKRLPGTVCCICSVLQVRAVLQVRMRLRIIFKCIVIRHHTAPFSLSSAHGISCTYAGCSPKASLHKGNEQTWMTRESRFKKRAHPPNCLQSKQSVTRELGHPQLRFISYNWHCAAAMAAALASISASAPPNWSAIGCSSLLYPRRAW